MRVLPFWETSVALSGPRCDVPALHLPVIPWRSDHAATTSVCPHSSLRTGSVVVNDRRRRWTGGPLEAPLQFVSHAWYKFIRQIAAKATAGNVSRICFTKRRNWKRKPSAAFSPRGRLASDSKSCFSCIAFTYEGVWLFLKLCAVMFM